MWLARLRHPEVPVSCVLRAGNETFDVDAFLEDSRWKPNAVYHRGEKRHPTSVRVTRVSGFNLEISHGAFEDFDRAVTDSVAFLERERAELSRLSALVGAGHVTLDFAVEYDREKHPFFGRTFPLSIIQAASKAGVKLELSFYPRAREHDVPNDATRPPS